MYARDRPEAARRARWFRLYVMRKSQTRPLSEENENGFRRDENGYSQNENAYSFFHMRFRKPHRRARLLRAPGEETEGSDGA